MVFGRWFAYSAAFGTFREMLCFVKSLYAKTTERYWNLDLLSLLAHLLLCPCTVLVTNGTVCGTCKNETTTTIGYCIHRNHNSKWFDFEKPTKKNYKYIYRLENIITDIESDRDGIYQSSAFRQTMSLHCHWNERWTWNGQYFGVAAVVVVAGWSLFGNYTSSIIYCKSKHNAT